MPIQNLSAKKNTIFVQKKQYGDTSNYSQNNSLTNSYGYKDQ